MSERSWVAEATPAGLARNRPEECRLAVAESHEVVELIAAIQEAKCPTMSGDSAEASKELKTHYNYIVAWEVALTSEYGQDQRSIERFLDRQRAGTSLRKLQGGGGPTRELESSYHRGMLTLRAMSAYPVAGFPELAAMANLWLPVQAYYVAHGLGSAALVAMGLPAPDRHSPFRSSFTCSICRFLPFPFCSLCSGGPGIRDYRFSDLDTDGDAVATQCNLVDPLRVVGHELMGKSLSTTRTKVLKERFAAERHRLASPKGRPRRLRREQKEAIAQDLRPTSVVDLLWRMRFGSNYEEPDMYMAGFLDPAAAAEHYKALLSVTRFLAAGLREIVRRKVGRSAMESLDAKLP